MNYGETLSTLRYASRAKKIVNRPTVNEVSVNCGEGRVLTVGRSVCLTVGCVPNCEEGGMCLL